MLKLKHLFLFLSLFYFGFFALFLSDHPVEFHDGYGFLIQAKRFLYPDLKLLYFDSTRPRGLILLLAFFEKFTGFLLGPMMPDRAFHLLMIGIAFLCGLSWYRLIAKVHSWRVGLMTCSLFLLFFPFFEIVPFVLADIFASLVLSCFLCVVVSYFHLFPNPVKTRYWLILGFIGALLGLTKYTLLGVFLLVIVGLVIIAVIRRSFHYKVMMNLALSLLVFLGTLEILQRWLGRSSEGIVFLAKLHVPYLSFLPGVHWLGLKSIPQLAVSVEPWYFYEKTLLVAFSSMFLILFAFGIFFYFRWSHNRLRDIKTENLLVMGVGIFLFVFHHLITHKENRYFVTFVPLILWNFSYLMDYLYRRLNRKMYRQVLACSLGVVVVTGFVRSYQSYEVLRRYQAPEFASTIEKVKTFVSESPCYKIVLCSVFFEEVPLDVMFYKYHFPTRESQAFLCEKEKPHENISAMVVGEQTPLCVIAAHYGNYKVTEDPFKLLLLR